VIPFLDELDDLAAATGAVNTVRVVRGCDGVRLKGFNTDVYGFSQSLQEWFAGYGARVPRLALVLGSGGAAKAVRRALDGLGVGVHTVSRQMAPGVYKTYRQLDRVDMETHLLVVNTTPLGMFPDTDACPDILYGLLMEDHWVFDLVYRPEETLFLRKARERGARTLNGLPMLHLQADRAWEIWQGKNTLRS
jgi:shikimate dehydrogenase